MQKTVYEVLKDYEVTRSKQEAAHIRSAIKRYLISRLLSALELKAVRNEELLDTLKRIPVDGFVEIADPIFQEQTTKIGNINTRKVLRSKWKHFCLWLQVQKKNIRVEKSSRPFTHIPKKTPIPPNNPLKSRLTYGLNEDELTPKLKQQLQDFHNFFQTVSQERQHSNRAVSQEWFQTVILLFWGWMKNVRHVPVAELDLESMTDLSLLKQYQEWLEQRDMAPASIRSYMGVCERVCWFIFSQSFSHQEAKQKIKPFKKLVRLVQLKDKELPVSDTASEAFTEPQLTRQECETILKYLEWRCKDFEEIDVPSHIAVDAWMDYLIIALLVTTGVRQREVRELSIGRLMEQQDGTYWVKLEADDHLTGTWTGQGKLYPLFVGPFQQQLSADLRYYLKYIRPNQDLNHDCLFFIRRSYTRGKIRHRGDPITDSIYLAIRVPRLLYQVTYHLFGAGKARAISCQDFQDITAIWVCTYGKPEDLSVYSQMIGIPDEVLHEQYAKIRLKASERVLEGERSQQVELGSSGSSSLSLQPDTLSGDEQLRLMRSLLKRVWADLPDEKQHQFRQNLSPLEQQILDSLNF